MIEHNGDLFTTDARIIGHGVNTFGVMGKGIAKTFKEKYPENYGWYKQGCDKGAVKPGDALVFVDNVGDNPTIINFVSQNAPGPTAQYDWLFESLWMGAIIVLIHNEKHDLGTTIAIPEIGCGIGGLEWKKVVKVIETVEAVLDNKIEFEVWHYVP